MFSLINDKQTSTVKVIQVSPYHTITNMIIENKIPATKAETEAATVTVIADVALFAELSFTVNK